MTVEVRGVGVEAFDEILPLVRRFPTARMTAQDWRWVLFEYPWSDEPTRGYAMYVDGAAVGFIATVLSTRPLLGRRERFCNPSSWIVAEPHRSASLLLLRRVMAMRDHTLVNLTPSPAAYRMFSRLGMRPLESEQIVLPPGPAVAWHAVAANGSVTSSPEALAAELSGDDLETYRALASSPVARHLLIRSGTRRGYVVATLARKRHVPYAEVQYASDWGLFWEHRAEVQAGIARELGLGGLWVAVDRRFLGDRPAPAGLRWKMRRLYRPSREEITPTMVDGLYSELMGIRF